jgi:hypothetical protein
MVSGFVAIPIAPGTYTANKGFMLWHVNSIILNTTAKCGNNMGQDRWIRDV